MKYKALIFDMDGLLFDSEKMYCDISIAVAKKHHLPLTKTVYLKYLGLSDEALQKAYLKEFANFSKEVVLKFLKEAYETTVNTYRSGKVPLKKGAKELLSWCLEKEIPCVLASSNNLPTIQAFLNQENLFPYFKKIFSIEDVTKGKPNPEVYLKAAASLPFEKSEILVLEDSKNGLQAAFQAQLPVFLIPDLLPLEKNLKQQATKVFPDLLAVKNDLAQ